MDKICSGPLINLQKAIERDKSLFSSSENRNNCLTYAVTSKRLDNVKYLLSIGVEHNQDIFNLPLDFSDKNFIIELLNLGFIPDSNLINRYYDDIEMLKRINNKYPLESIKSFNYIFRNVPLDYQVELIKEFPKLIIAVDVLDSKDLTREVIENIDSPGVKECMFLLLVRNRVNDEIVKFYNHYHPDINMVISYNYEKVFPLYYSVSYDDVEITKFLLKNGANPNLVGGYGKPLNLTDNMEILGILENYGANTEYDDLASCNLVDVEKIGRGSYGSVFSLKRNGNIGTALKYIRYDSYSYVFGIYNISEISIMFDINHYNIIHGISLITQALCPINGIGIEMPLGISDMTEMYNKKISIKTQKEIFFKVGLGIDFLNRNNIAHLDIKSANVIFRNSTYDPVLIDFGLSRLMLIPNYEVSQELCTPTHRPIELFESRKMLSITADVWSFGCMLLYNFCHSDSGLGLLYDDFLIEDIHNAMKKILDSDYLSQVVRQCYLENDDLIDIEDLLSKIFVEYPQRWTMEQVLNHRFFRNFKYTQTGNFIRDDKNEYHDISYDFNKMEQFGRNLPTFTFFLFVDLCIRTIECLNNIDLIFEDVDYIVCMMIAIKLTMNKVTDLINNMKNKYSLSDVWDDLISRETMTVTLLKGRLMPMNIYRTCKNRDQVRRFRDILRNRQYHYRMDESKIIKELQNISGEKIPIMYVNL